MVELLNPANPSGLLWAVGGLIALSMVGGGLYRLPGRLLARAWMRWRSDFGRSDWAGLLTIYRAGMLRPGGLFLGQWRRWPFAADLYRHGEGHLLSVAAPGAGKTTGLIVPALCELRHGSVIVTDPKAQLAAMTARHRATIGPVLYINPFAVDLAAATGVRLPDSGFNPLSVLEDGPNLKDDAENLARLLLVTDRQDSGSYWNTEAAGILALFMVWMVLKEPKENRTLAHLYKMVRLPNNEMKDQLAKIVAKGPSDYLKYEGNKFISLHDVPPQWTGVVSKAQIATSRYAPGSPLGIHTAMDGLDLRQLKQTDLTVYLMIPTGRTKVAAPWLNLLMGVFGLAIGKPGPARPVFLLMDEAPALGYLPDLRNHLRESREAGLRTWIFTQTRAALADEQLYGANGFRDIMALCDTRTFFSIDDLDLARDISAILGERTGIGRSQSDRGNENASLTPVPLMRHDEIMRMPKGRTLIVRSGMKPIRARLVPYWTREKWAAMTDKNPYRD